MFHFYEVQLKNEQQKIEYEFMSRQFQVQADYYQKLTNEHETINKTIHDIKNTLLAIEGCINGYDYKGAIHRINEICSTLSDRTKIFTSNIIVDTILTAKEKEAQTAGLDFKIFASSFNESNVDPIDLGVILGNALDNAIEACRNIPEDKDRKIQTRILLIDDYLSIVIENNVEKPVQIVDGMIASTKQSAYHGFGIKNIKALVEKYDGDVQLRYDADKFSINMLLKSS
jgi:sensor histidine kinase regulating citrate/malate metabolism